MSVVLKLASACKVNLLLNILGRRDDGFHELETLIHPVPMYDELHLERIGDGINLSCNDTRLALDETNLVFRAAKAFLKEVKSTEGVRIHLQKNLPIAAGIGAGSANAGMTLRGLNELWGQPLPDESLHKLAGVLGSDVPFFLQDGPALAFHRGEKIDPIDPFPALQGTGLLLINPGFGVSTPWAYRQLGEHPVALKGEPGRAQALAGALRKGTLTDASNLFYNSLEIPVFAKHPVLPVIRDYFKENGAIVSLMSGSGATIFALTSSRSDAEKLREKYHGRFGEAGWSRTVLL